MPDNDHDALSEENKIAGPLQGPLSAKFEISQKTQVRVQCAALCWRADAGEVQVLLITSRNTRRWIIPKGWPINGYSAPQTAMQEAWEEIGVRGQIDPRPLGVYPYTKRMKKSAEVTCMAVVYAIKVASMEDVYPEMNQRAFTWVSPEKAATMVKEPGLADLMAHFNPAGLADPSLAK